MESKVIFVDIDENKVNSINFAKIFPQIEYAKSAQEVINKSDAVLIVTEWREFEELNYEGKIVIDGRRW